MVAISKIKPEVEYSESKRINEEDKGHLSSIYEIEIIGKRVAVAVGKIKYTYTKKDIVYYLVYLIKNDTVKSQIGIIELNTKELTEYIDRDDNIDFEKFAEMRF